MEKINLNKLSITDLYNLQKSCLALYEKEQNEYMSLRSQVSPRNVSIYSDSLSNMEQRMQKFTSVRNEVLNEIERRIENIENEEVEYEEES